MQQLFDDSEIAETQTQSNYPIEADDSFTPDQIEEINEYKEQVKKKIAKNDSVLRGLETFFWGISSYSICKWLILNLGSGGINLAIATALIVNQIVNRDCLDSFNLNKSNDGWEVAGMSKLFKFLFGLVASAFVVWSSIGNFIGMLHDSKTTYHALNSAVEEYNQLPQRSREEMLQGIVIGVSAVGIIYMIANANKR
jgi:hypothetical protein